MKKVIAVAFSDLHLANWKQFNEDEYRMREALLITQQIINKATKYSVPVLFAGDFIDHPKYLDNVLMGYLVKMVKTVKTMRRTLIGINGNHDLAKVNSNGNRVPGYFTYMAELVPNFICVDFHHYDTDKESTLPMRIHGIPYLNHNVGFIQALEERVKNLKKGSKNILLIHRDLAGALEPDGKLVKKDKDGDSDIKRLFKKFDLVLSGHIHKPQAIKALGKNVLMLGAPYQQRRSDKECEMGYWLIFNDMSRKFIPIETSKFRTYEDGDTPENGTDFWIKLPKGSVADNTRSTKNFNVKTDRKTLLKAYLKKKNIKSKSKLNLLMKYLND